MYVFSQAMRAIRSNWIASVATITTTTLSLTILSGFSLVSLNLNSALVALQGELEMAVYLENDADITLLLDQINQWPEINEVFYINKEVALMEMIQDLPSLQQGAALVDNPLPDTLALKLYNPTQTLLISHRLRLLPGVTDVEDGSETVETFIAINYALRISGSILIVVLLASALFAIVNSIRAAIAARGEEIEVMRLVGATRRFIRAPFLVEGFLLGLFSSVVTLSLIVPSYLFVIDRLTVTFPFVPLVRDSLQLSQVAALITALALLIGLVGSTIAVSQYLRERT
jgi:cell division transport system permease protein|tara:strand:+ start:20316 stop:21176 length:861 start_codon:yes stop_codon:yes gene_type:complete